MKLVTCIQGSMEWFDARLGKPTASRFAEIVTPTGKASAGAGRRSYMLELLAERLQQKTQPHYVSAQMERGTLLEPRARAWYEIKTGRDVEQVGFVLRDDGRCGCSPDGLLTDRGLEIKALGRGPHLECVLSGKPQPAHYVQCQGGCWVCDRDVWDFVLWTDEPGIPCRVIEIPRNEVMMAAFDAALPAFCDELDELEAQAREMGGGVPRMPSVVQDNSAWIMGDAT